MVDSISNVSNIQTLMVKDAYGSYPFLLAVQMYLNKINFASEEVSATIVTAADTLHALQSKLLDLSSSIESLIQEGHGSQNYTKAMATNFLKALGAYSDEVETAKAEIAKIKANVATNGYVFNSDPWDSAIEKAVAYRDRMLSQNWHMQSWNDPNLHWDIKLYDFVVLEQKPGGLTDIEFQDFTNRFLVDFGSWVHNGKETDDYNIGYRMKNGDGSSAIGYSTLSNSIFSTLDSENNRQLNIFGQILSSLTEYGGRVVSSTSELLKTLVNNQKTQG